MAGTMEPQFRAQSIERVSLETSDEIQLAVDALRVFERTVIEMFESRPPGESFEQPGSNVLLLTFNAAASALAGNLAPCPYEPGEGKSWTSVWLPPPPAPRHAFRCGHKPPHCSDGSFAYLCP